MGISAGNNKSTAPTINVTPLIDVLLVLLIIFMVITPVKLHKFETKIPEKPTEISDYPPSNDLLVLTINREREININSQSITTEELGDRVKEIIERRPIDQRTLFIKAPKELPYSFVVNIIDKIKGAGANPIGLQVDYIDQI